MIAGTWNDRLCEGTNVRSDIGAGGNRRLDHFRAIFLQLNRRLNLLNVVERPLGNTAPGKRLQATSPKALRPWLGCDIVRQQGLSS